MSHHVARNVRAKEILTLLKNHGPLTFKAISLLVEPPMAKRKLEMALARLKNNHLIEVRNEKLLGQKCLIYQAPQFENSRERAAKLLSCHKDEFLQPYFRYRELLHNDGCAILGHKLRKMFPDSKIIRDFQLYTDPTVSNVLLTSPLDRDLKPDLVLHYPRTDSFRSITVVFELEKTHKDHRRLAQKIIKYSAKSRVDGIIYLCDTEGIATAIRGTYKDNALHRALRISHYGSHFLLFANAKHIHIDAIENVHNFDGKPVCLKQWIHTLRSTDRTERRESGFGIGAHSRPS